MIPKPPSPTPCPACQNQQALFDPVVQKVDAGCFVCHGAGWVDTTLTCSCGKAATWWHEASKGWYCGAAACDPAKPQAKYDNYYDRLGYICG